MSGYTVAIVGRPNVGKSTFFNRLLEQRKAIVDDVSGVTRDRQYGIAEWNGKTFNVIDTGGFVPRSEDVFEQEIKKQVLIALDEADALIFMTDTATGITDLDEAMADVLRRTTKPVYLVVNKVDNNQRMLEATEFYSLGFEKIFLFPLSAAVAQVKFWMKWLPPFPKIARRMTKLRMFQSLPLSDSPMWVNPLC